MRWKTDICAEAKTYAKEYYVNEEKEKAFKYGVLWVVEKLERMTAGSAMDVLLSPSDKAYMAKLTVRDVKALCTDVKLYIKEQS